MVEGQFDESGLPFVSGVIAFPSLKGRVPAQEIRLLVDTGSSASLISPRDILGLGLTNHLHSFRPSFTPKLGIAGIVSNVSYLARAIIVLPGEPFSIQLLFGNANLDLLDLRPFQGLPGEEKVPSILGWDALRHLVCFFDRERAYVWLCTREDVQRGLP